MLFPGRFSLEPGTAIDFEYQDLGNPKSGIKQTSSQVHRHFGTTPDVRPFHVASATVANIWVCSYTPTSQYPIPEQGEYSRPDGT